MTEIANQPGAQPRAHALTALVTGIGSFVFFLVFVMSSAGVLVLWCVTALGIAAIVFGIIALKRRQPKGLAVTGLVIGACSVLLALAMLVFALVFVGFFMSDTW